MYVKPTHNTPAAIRRARFLREQAARNAAAQAALIKSVEKPKG